MNSKDRECLICNKLFVVKYQSVKTKTCSKACKNILAGQITTIQFASQQARDNAREVALKQKSDNNYLDKFTKGMQKRKLDWKSRDFHPRKGAIISQETRDKIGDGNRGLKKGMTWEQIMGAELATKRRRQNSESMQQTNETLLSDRKSGYENMIFKSLVNKGFKQNSQLGKYNVDFINVMDKVVIEFYGDFWHANPSMYQSDWINPVTGIVAKEKWLMDKKRIDSIESKGYRVITIWEFDVIKNRKINQTELTRALTGII